MTAKPLTRAEITILTGLEIAPHPDGKPWSKCCGDKDSCTCAMRIVPADHLIFGQPIDKPQNRVEYLLTSSHYAAAESKKQIQNLLEENGRFFCVHRKTDDGYHRECAGWAAKYHPESRNATTERDKSEILGVCSEGSGAQAGAKH